jgi:hypothetical protein
MKTIFTKSLLITAGLLLAVQVLFAEVDSLSCTIQSIPVTTTGCHTYIGYYGTAGSPATYGWGWDGGIVISGSGPGPYWVYWTTPGYKTIQMYVVYNGQTCSTSHVIEVKESPDVFNVDGGGGYPQGGSGVHIYLSGSQVNHTYYLFLNGSTQSLAYKAGTGSPLDFGLFTAPGWYKCMVSTDSTYGYCDVWMNDSAHVYMSGAVPNQAICIVSYDTLSQKNRVKWYKTGGQHIAHYNIYRQTYQYNVYEKIGEAPYAGPNYYIDTTSFPIMMPYRYKITATDSSGGVSEFSPFHKSIHLEVSPGVSGFNLIWNAYEGCDYLTCRIHRRLAAGPWTVIDSVASDVTSYTDPYLTSGLAWYYIEVVRYYPCPGSKSTMDEDAISSNFSHAAPVGVSGNSADQIAVYPNPATDRITIACTGQVPGDAVAQLYSAEGRLLLTQSLMSPKTILDISGMAPGVYYLRITGDRSSSVRKVVKQ